MASPSTLFVFDDEIPGCRLTGRWITLGPPDRPPPFRSLPTFAELLHRYEDAEQIDRIWKRVDELLLECGITKTREELGLVGDPRKLRDHGFLPGEMRQSEGKKPPYSGPSTSLAAYLDPRPEPGRMCCL